MKKKSGLSLTEFAAKKNSNNGPCLFACLFLPILSMRKTSL